MKYYISFGQSHTHSISGRTIDKDNIVVIEAANYKKANEYAHAVFDKKFCMIYEKEPDMSYFPRGLINL